MIIDTWLSPKEQMCNLGSNHWSVARLHMLAKDFEVMDVPPRPP